MPGWATFRHSVGLARCSDDKGITHSRASSVVRTAGCLDSQPACSEGMVHLASGQGRKESAGAGHQSFGPTTVIHKTNPISREPQPKQVRWVHRLCASHRPQEVVQECQLEYEDLEAAEHDCPVGVS